MNDILKTRKRKNEYNFAKYLELPEAITKADWRARMLSVFNWLVG